MTGWKWNFRSGIVILMGLLSLTCVVVSQDEQQPSRGYQLPPHDGKRRIVTLTTSNFDRLKKDSEALVIYYEMPHYGHEEGKRSYKAMRDMLELTAQLTQDKSIKVGVIDLVKSIDLAQSLKFENQYPGFIVVYHKGHFIPFHGHRSVEILSVFLMKLVDDPVHEIDGKGRKKLYDAVELPKVIGYFQEDSEEYKAFEEAAIPFRPVILFYSVFSKKMAKLFHLKKLNSISFTKPYEKPISFKGEKVTKDKVIDFIKKNKRQQLAKLHVETLHENWPIVMKGYLVAAFIRSKSKDGTAFFSNVKSLAKRHSGNDKLAFVWINPDEFPQMHNYWQRGFNIDIKNNIIGVVNVTSNESTWYRRTAQDKTSAKDLNVWLSDVLDGSVLFEGFNSKAPHPTREKQEL